MTWAFSRRRSVLMGSTPASQPDTASWLQTLRADTAAGWRSSTGHCHYSRWRSSGRRKCRLNSALTISGMGGTEVWNRRSGEWPRPTSTWAFSRRRSVLMGSTHASRPDTASWLQTLRADTAAGWRSSTGHRHYLWWRPSGNMDPTYLALRLQREGSDGTSLDVTSPPTTLGR